MTAETAFNLYLDTNVYLVFSALIWMAATRVLRRTDLRYSHEIRLRVAYALLVVVAILPIAFMLVDHLGGAQAVKTISSLSLSDFAVAQFLEGRIDMAPTAFEAMLNLRDTFVRDIIGLRTEVGIFVALVLAAGVAAGLFRLIRELGRIRNILDSGFRLRRIGRVDIILTDEVRVPLSTRGLRRYYVVVPTEFLYSPGDLGIAVRHELQHIRQGDVTWEFILELVRPLVFWNPAFSYWKREIEARRELACDRALLSGGRVKASDYSDCLFRTCERLLRRDAPSRLAALNVPFAASAGPSARRVLLTRFEMLIQPVSTRNACWCAVLAAPVLAVFLLVGLATHASSDWSHDRIMLSTIVNLERLDSRVFPVPMY